ncbi:MAG: glycerol-3-phosphate 1-O-acyltransferase PlsY [Lachnospiraceae bacterium]|nr:glycerol-3-phosphate 1-O-acyltransferase PlsY [Lachnospiraceae bacterium]
MEIFLAALIGYVLGSVPFALVIGKLFYRTDIRTAGSKNLGGGNAGRVLGSRAGLAVMTLDVLKVTLAIFITAQFDQHEITLVTAGVAAAIGHCYPVFARFKGGKAVATMYGFLFGMAVFTSYDLWIFFVPLITFMVVLYLWKIISLASMLSAVVSTIFLYVATGSWTMVAASALFTLLIIVRHRSNIRKMINHEENKISWM